MPGKMGKTGSISSAQGEPKSQSKVNSALSYGKRTGKTYVNKAEPPKKKKMPPTPGGRVVSAAIKKPVRPKARGGR
jgi:hypothetical protein